MPARSTLAILGALILVAVVTITPWPQHGRSVAGDPPGCAPARPHSEGTFDETITTSDGLTREYILNVPASYTGADPLPLIVNPQPVFAEPSIESVPGYIIMVPRITDRPPGLDLHEIYRWNFAQLPVMADDVAYIDEVLAALESQLCIDHNRVYATGGSNGGLMSVRLACSLSDRIAAIAVFSGVYFPPLAPELNPDELCPDTRPVPIVAFHGDADTVIPFNGGTSFEVTFRDIDDEVMPLWAAHNRCDPVPTEEPVADTVRLVRYQGCAHDATVELYIFEGGTHAELGGLDFDFDVMAFFEAHPLILEPVLTPTPCPIEGCPTPTPAATPFPTLTPEPTLAEPIDMSGTWNTAIQGEGTATCQQFVTQTGTELVYDGTCHVTEPFVTDISATLTGTIDPATGEFSVCGPEGCGSSRTGIVAADGNSMSGTWSFNGFSGTFTGERKVLVFGDASCDGTANSIDAALILQFSAALIHSLNCQENADVNGDGTINAIDAALILQFTAGLLNSLPP